MKNRIKKFLSKKLPWHSYVRALLFNYPFDYFERYLIVLKILKKMDKIYKNRRNLMVLEVGAGSNSPLKKYYSNIYNITTVDLVIDRSIDLVASATNLPFANKAFDIVVASDLIEHIPNKNRERVLSELVRVGRVVIIHSPLISKNSFNSRYYDYLLLKFLLKSSKKNYKLLQYLLQHIIYKQPHLETFTKRGFRILRRDWSVKVWFVMMKSQLASKGIVSRIVLLLYIILFKNIRTKPFYGAYLIYIE